MKTLIIIPAYNEEDNICATISDLKEANVEADVVVINDKSTDSTKDVLKKEKIPFLDLPINLGIGGGVQTGYQYALENDFDIAVQFDGDGQHCAAYINDLLEPIKSGTADFVIGSRFINKEGFQSSGLRRLGIGFLSNLIYILCGIKVYDVTSGMRAVNRKLIQFFAEEYAQDYPEPEAIVAAKMINARITEIPVQMKERINGKSSINSIRSVYYMIKVSAALILSRINYRR